MTTEYAHALLAKRKEAMPSELYQQAVASYQQPLDSIEISQSILNFIRQ